MGKLLDKAKQFGSKVKKTVSKLTNPFPNLRKVKQEMKDAKKPGYYKSAPSRYKRQSPVKTPKNYA